MKMFDKMKNFFLPTDDEYIQEDENTENMLSHSNSVQREQRNDYSSTSRPLQESSFQHSDTTADEKRNKVVKIQATAQLQVVLVKPEVFTDAKQVADHLIARKTVVLNLETASTENKRRIIDFLVGVAYANKGSLKPVANQTYLITPYNVDFVGEDLVGELENNGITI